MSGRILEPQDDWALHDVLLPQVVGRSLYTIPATTLPGNDVVYYDNAHFWYDIIDNEQAFERTITLCDFHLFEWFPRNPGLFHTPQAANARESAQYHILPIADQEYQRYVSDADAPPDHAVLLRSATAGNSIARQVIYTPSGKASMLQGGIGCVRLSSVEFKSGGIHWFMSASSSNAPDEGVPIALPNELYRRAIQEIRGRGFSPVTIVGRIRFIEEAFRDLYSVRHGIPRVYVLVDKISPSRERIEYGLISVASSFISEHEGFPRIYASYVTFDPGHRHARRGAAHWLRREYVEGLYKGFLLTDFDQQAPTIANTLFSLDDVLTSSDMADAIMNLRTTYGYFDWSMLERRQINFTIHRDRLMVKTVISHNQGNVNIAAGKNINADQGIRIESLKLEKQELQQLAEELGILRRAIDAGPDDPDVDILKGAIAQVEVSARKEDVAETQRALEGMRPYAKKLLDLSEKIGVGIATAALKSLMGL